ncbi:hypothetical protein PIB30_018504 [Stylosanthes scabra]|uniref:Uncharacterized protein n=1 Tax=Stylosanthes scabra TaxID=79078 RepID=A0ABU6X5X5_9FABA|nr:hypothetical protein [Stylosanthes scabra]
MKHVSLWRYKVPLFGGVAPLLTVGNYPGLTSDATSLTIAPETSAKVTGSSPTIVIRVEATRKAHKRVAWEAELELVRERNGRATRIKALDFDGKIPHREKWKIKEESLEGDEKGGSGENFWVRC